MNANRLASLSWAELVVWLGIGLSGPIPCLAAGPPDFDPGDALANIDEFATAFDSVVVRTKDASGNDVAEVHIPNVTIRQTLRNGRLAEAAEIDLDFDWLAKQPGAEIARSFSKGGEEVTEFRRGGVVIRQSKHGSTPTQPEVVKAGDAPIYCLRLFFVVDLVELNQCFPNTHDEVRMELSRDIDAITKFIAENSLFPMTLKQSQYLTSRIMRNYSEPLEHASPEMIGDACHSGEFGRMAQYDVPTWSAAQFRRQTEEALRIPRPPLGCTGL